MARAGLISYTVNLFCTRGPSFYFCTEVPKLPSAHQGTLGCVLIPAAWDGQKTPSGKAGAGHLLCTTDTGVPAKVAVWTGLPQTEASFFWGLRRRAFINRTKPGGPGASRAVGEKAGCREPRRGAPRGRRPRPARARGLKGPLCRRRRPPAAERALPQLRQTLEAPPPL